MPGENFRSVGYVKCCATCSHAYQRESLECTVEDKTGDILNPDDGDECEPILIFDLCDDYRKGTPQRWD